MKENDLPINSIDDDRLEVKKDVKALCKFILESDTPLTISIQGEWGCGKSSFMKCIEQELCDPSKEPHYDSIWISAWDFFLSKSMEGAVTSIIALIYSHFAKLDTDAEKTEKKYRLIEKFRVVSSAGAQIANISTETTERVFNFFDKDILTKKNELQKYINQRMGSENDKRVILFIDDLDRLDPEMALSILEALKIIFDLEGFIFILAIDKEFLERGVIQKYNLTQADSKRVARDYFEKIIQVPYSIPIARYSIEPLVKERLENIQFFLDRSSEEYRLNLEEAVQIISIATDKNPRRINRLLNLLKLAFLANEDSIQENTDFHMITLILLCIQLVFPDVYMLLSREKDLNMWDKYLHMINDAVSSEEIKKYSLNTEWKKVIYLYTKEDAVNPELFFKCIELLKRFEVIQRRIGSSNVQIALGIVDFSNHVTYDGENYNKNSAIQHQHGVKFIDYYKDIIKAKNVQNILDVGCGNGKTTIEMWELNGSATVDAIDLSESQIAIAKEKYKEYLKAQESGENIQGKIMFEVKDIISLQQTSAYDLVFSSSALHWVKEQERAYRNIFNALRPGGRVISNQAGKKDNIKTYAGIHKVVWDAILELNLEGKYPENWEFPMYCFSEAEIQAMLKKIGFTGVKTILFEGQEKDAKSLVEPFIHASLIFYKQYLTQKEYHALEDKFRELMLKEDVDLSYKLLYISARKPTK